jgi:hypothetical protein
MISFGFSAFLKLLSLNEKPHRTELRRRLGPSTGGGYDFHKSFRLLARRYLVEGAELADVLAAARKITKTAERESALDALQRLEPWRAVHPGTIVTAPSVTFESPSRLFRVHFEADLGLLAHGKITAIHIWNTMRPPLAPGAVYGALTLMAQSFSDQDHAPDDIGVLSMREPMGLSRLSVVADQSALAVSIVARLEEAIRGAPPAAPPEHRPSLT